jgi:hypothetical protein
MPVHLLSEDVSLQEDSPTSWPSSSGIRGRRRTYLTILELADHALFSNGKVNPSATSKAGTRWTIRGGVFPRRHVFAE